MTLSQWVDYCARTWPDLPREAIEQVASRHKDVYRVRQAVCALLKIENRV